MNKQELAERIIQRLYDNYPEFKYLLDSTHSLKSDMINSVVYQLEDDGIF